MGTDVEALFAQHHRQLIRYLYRAVGQADAASDLAQDVFLRISRTAIPVASTPEIRAWVFRIARNVALDYHRQRRREPALAPLVDHQKAASQDVAVAVQEALASLPDLDRDVFLMREVSGLGYAEIAAACELTADAVRSRIHRARLQLREQLSAPIAIQRSSPLRHSARSPKGE